MYVIEQNVDIPASRRLTIDVPSEIPVGATQIVIHFPVSVEVKGQSKNEIFRSAMRRAYGAWGDNPAEDGVAKVRAMRDEWRRRDPWDSGTAKQPID